MKRKKIFGLDISDHSIEALVLSKSFFGKPRMSSYARVVPRGAVVTNGVIKNPEKLGAAIMSALQSAKPRAIKTPYCVVSLPESQVFSTVFTLPAGLRRSEMRTTIIFKAEEVIPFKSAEVYYDFRTISRTKGTQEVLYVAVPMKTVDAYVSALTAVGLVPVALDVESISSARALAASGATALHVAIDIGARTTNVSIIDKGVVRQSLSIAIAGNRFTKAVAKALGVTEKEADVLKVKNGFDEKLQQGKALTALRGETKKIITEIKKFIEYYQEQTHQTISSAVLVGGSALLPQIDQILADGLGLEVTVGNPLAGLAGPHLLANVKSKPVLYTNVIGLALRAFTKNVVTGDINLLPIAERRFSVMPSKDDARSWHRVYGWIGLAILSAGCLGVLAYLKYQNIDPYRTLVPVSPQNIMIDPSIDVGALDELRNAFAIPTPATTTATGTTTSTATSTTTSTDPIIGKRVKISATTLGYVNVREDAGTTFPKVGEARSGVEYEVLASKDGWYQIALSSTIQGWVLASYVEPLP